MHKIVKELKENNQDFEWYPTTNEIIECLYKDIKKYIGNEHREESFSMLDIGAGNGSVFKKFEDINNYYLKEEIYKYGLSFCNKYAIEKSKILIDEMPPDIFIIGTDFKQQTLIDKRMDVIFCNPPYIEYTLWMEKIIKEANCEYIYMAIPERWATQKNIKDAIDYLIDKRKAEYDIIGNFDFLNSEDRKARAKVHLLRIVLPKTYSKNDPFNIWFDESFKIKADKSEYSYLGNAEDKKNRFSVLTRKNLVNELELLYQEDMNKLINNYRSLEDLDYDMMKELNINIEGLKESLKTKIEGLKNLYWRELFDNLDSLVDRLTSGSRKKLLDKLLEHTTVDFTASNCYSIIIWAIKNSNLYFDEQLKDVYFKISSKDNIINYKSNKHIIKDTWRYAFFHGEIKNYKLDYRIVYSHHNAIQIDRYGSYDYINKLSKSAIENIEDIFTIAKNLGFSNITSPREVGEWTPGGKKEFYYLKNEIPELFAEIKAHKNGNLHFKFNQEFMKKFNIEASRLNGWVKNEKQAAYELDIDLGEIKKYYKSNLNLEVKDMPIAIAQ